MPRQEGGARETDEWPGRQVDKRARLGEHGGSVAGEAGFRVRGRSTRKVNSAAQVRIPGRKGGESVGERASS